MNNNSNNKKYNEKGITAVALTVTVLVLAILTRLTISTFTRDADVIDTTETAAMESNILSYKEEISHSVRTEIIIKSAIGETATVQDIVQRLSKESFINSANLVQNGADTEGDITIITKKENYIFHIYYNSIHEKIDVDYLGKLTSKSSEDIASLIPSIKANYDETSKTLTVETKDDKNGINKIDLIYQNSIITTQKSPNTQAIFNVSNCEAGWYKVRVTSNSGLYNYTSLRVTDYSTKVEAPIIENYSLNEANSNKIQIRSNTENIKGIYYTQKDQNTLSNGTYDETKTYTEPIEITSSGLTTVTAWVVGEDDKPSKETIYTVKCGDLDLNKIELSQIGTSGQEGWMTSDVEVKITGIEDTSKIKGYYYSINDEEEKYVNDITKTLKVSKEGITKISVKIVDKSGNMSDTITTTVKKDTIEPIEFTPVVISQGENSFKINVFTKDGGKLNEASKVVKYDIYVDKGNTTIAESKGNETGEYIVSGENIKAGETYNIYAIAFDEAGNSKTSSGLPVTLTEGGINNSDIPTLTPTPSFPEPVIEE